MSQFVLVPDELASVFPSLLLGILRLLGRFSLRLSTCRHHCLQLIALAAPRRLRRGNYNVQNGRSTADIFDAMSDAVEYRTEA